MSAIIYAKNVMVQITIIAYNVILVHIWWENPIILVWFHAILIFMEINQIG